MSLTVSDVVIDCAEHGAVVEFWAAALDYEPRALNEQYVALVPRERGPGKPPLLFQRVPEGKVVKNRVHLDFKADDREADVARLVGLGAVEGPTWSLGRLTWTVMSDPEGNEFCVS